MTGDPLFSLVSTVTAGAKTCSMGSMYMSPSSSVVFDGSAGEPRLVSDVFEMLSVVYLCALLLFFAINFLLLLYVV